MIKKIITVEGMHCMHCAGSVEKAISNIEGAKSAKVNLDKKICVTKLSGDVSDELLMAAVRDAGFEPIGIETKKSLF